MNSDSSLCRSSVSDWLDSVKQGSDSAAQKIWERYVEQLVREANQRLGTLPNGCADGEDVAQEAFTSFFRGIADGRFPQLDDRDDLWQILIVLTSRRANDYQRRELAQRRGGGEVRGNSGVRLVPSDGSARPDAFDSLEALPVTPQSADELLQLIRISFPEIAHYDLQHIALDRAANYSDAEIAQRRGLSLRGVQRKLNLIRSILTQAAEADARS